MFSEVYRCYKRLTGGLGSDADGENGDGETGVKAEDYEFE